MAITAKWYGKAFSSAFSKEIDFNSDTIKCALCTSSYVPDQDTHQYYDTDITNEVANGNGYVTGGATIANPSLTYDAVTNTLKLDGDDVEWTAATFTARYAVIYDSTPAVNKPLLCWVDFDGDLSPSNGTLSITWSADGIAKVVVA